MFSWLGFLVIFFYVSLAFSFVHSNNTVIWYAPFYSGGGYSSEAQAFAFSIHQQLQTILSSSVSLPPSSTIEFYINQHGDTPKSSYLKSLRTEERNRLLSMDFTFLEKESSLLYSHRKATSTVVAICHSEPGAWDAPIPFYQTTPCPPHYADIRIGRTMFETDRLPDGWEDRINTMHEVWVPTDLTRDIFIRAGVKRKKVVVLPEPVDTDFFRPRNVSDLTLSGIKNRSLRRLLEAAMITNSDSSKRFTFLFVGKWETRKQLKLLLRAFFTEFQDAVVTKVQLAVLTSQYHSTTDFKKEIEKFIQAEKSLRQYSQFVADSVIVLSNVKQEYMPYLYSAVDVLVIPSFGEGWGRPHVEAMSCGTPVIATNWSGPVAYLTESNGYPLAVERMVSASAEGWEGHKWALASQNHLQILMRRAFENSTELTTKGLRARNDMIEKYSLSVIGNLTLHHFHRVLKQYKRRTNTYHHHKSDELR